MSSQSLEQIAARPVINARVGQATAVEQSRAVAEVQAAIIVAQQCPRDMNRAWAEMKAACDRLSLAERAFYAVNNRGRGPSVHLARELARIWGNLDYGVRELHRDDERGESEVLAHAWDQQTNTRSTRSLIVPHLRMRKVDGKQTRERLFDLGDVYLNNQNIGARAVRECLFSVMPADFVTEAQDRCRATIERGDGKPLPERIADMITAFAGIGVTVGRIETRLERKRGQWNAADVADLSVVYSSIKRNDTTADEQFPVAQVTADEITNRPTVKAATKPKTVKPVDEPAPVETPAEDGWPDVPPIGGDDATT